MTNAQIEEGLRTFQADVERGGGGPTVSLCQVADGLYNTLMVFKKSIGSGSFPSASWAIGRGIAAIHGGISKWKRDNGC